MSKSASIGELFHALVSKCWRTFSCLSQQVLENFSMSKSASIGELSMSKSASISMSKLVCLGLST